MKRTDFIGSCIMEMMSYSVKIQFQKHSDTNYLSYFETDVNNKNPHFFVAYSVDNYFQDTFESFVHEYCHFVQWKNKTKMWENARYYPYLPNQKKKYIRNIQSVERDCDKRVVKLIDDLNLPIIKDVYIKKSNSYLLLYNYVFENPHIKMDSVYSKEEVYSTLPGDKFLTNKDLEKDYPLHRESFFKNYK